MHTYRINSSIILTIVYNPKTYNRSVYYAIGSIQEMRFRILFQFALPEDDVFVCRCDDVTLVRDSTVGYDVMLWQSEN